MEELSPCRRDRYGSAIVFANIAIAGSDGKCVFSARFKIGNLIPYSIPIYLHGI